MKSSGKTYSLPPCVAYRDGRGGFVLVPKRANGQTYYVDALGGLWAGPETTELGSIFSAIGKAFKKVGKVALKVAPVGASFIPGVGQFIAPALDMVNGAIEAKAAKKQLQQQQQQSVIGSRPDGRFLLYTATRQVQRVSDRYIFKNPDEAFAAGVAPDWSNVQLVDGAPSTGAAGAQGAGNALGAGNNSAASSSLFGLSPLALAGLAGAAALGLYLITKH